MTLRLYDTLSRTVRDFVPLRPGVATIYLCGATVQSPPHIGHIRSGVSFDVLRRWLTASGLDVTFVRNVTDIDYKILATGDSEQFPFWVVSARNERAFAWAYDVLGCLPPTIEPRATGHIPEMITLMHRLIDSGHAYAADGDVYFDVQSFPEYGALSRQRVTEMQSALDGESTRKRDARDFALWKGAKPGEPSWDTPWGPGRPGWHLECSAMAERYCGEAFDIHGGGLDLVFPHHENEIAQSRAVGDDFANFWLHNAWVTTSGEKMSKSLGNSLLVTEVVKRVRPVELRYYLASAHYRSMIEYSEAALEDAGAAYRRIEGFIERAARRSTQPAAPAQWPGEFAAALDDDLGVPQALAVIHDTVRAGNSALAANDEAGAAQALASVLAMLDVLGLAPSDWQQGAGDDAKLRDVVDKLVIGALDERAAARARKDFAAADAVRDRLRGAGIAIEDTPDGVQWSLLEPQEN